MINRPQVFMKYFSDDPKLVEEAKREVAHRLYEMEHPPSWLLQPLGIHASNLRQYLQQMNPIAPI
jgi:hypothetical protein